MPIFASSFNGWHFQKMQEVVPYCMKNDLSPPNFTEECVADGLIKPKKDGRLTEDMQKTVQLYAEAYYQTYWQEVLLKMMRFKKPQIANAHLLTNESLQFIAEKPVYICAAWVPPGRHTYCVSYDSEDVSTTEEVKNDYRHNFLTKIGLQFEKKRTFYVHDMLSTLREEGIPFYHNPRHVQTITKDRYQTRPVFDSWTRDTTEVISQMLGHDKYQWHLRDLCETDKQYRLLESVIQHNFSLFTDTYHYLQTKSKSYPWVSFQTARQSFFIPAIVKQGWNIEQGIFDTIIKEAHSSNNRRRPAVQSDDPKTLNRAQFIELMVLLARAILVTDDNNSPLYGISLTKSIQLFVNKILKQFLTDVGLEW